MGSSFFEGIGLGSIDIGLLVFIFAIVVFILLVFVIVLLLQISKLKKRITRFCGGKNAKSLEEEIGTMFEENNKIKEQGDKNRKDIRIIYRRMESTFQKVGLVKYDAFSQMGGKLSYALCMLDEKDNGFIINSVHSSDSCYSYSKEIIGGMCELELGQEEHEALNKALQSK